MSTTLETLQARLAQAEEAYHALQIGDKEVSVGYGDKQATFTPARADKLAAYIKDLELKIARLTGDTTGRRRPITVGF